MFSNVFISLQAAIDLDLHEIKVLLHGNPESNMAWTMAERMYREGAHSRPVAELKLGSPILQDLPSGTPVSGNAVANGTTVTGTVYHRVEKGDEYVLIQYDIKEDQENYVGCQVGGNPEPKTDGCKYFYLYF